jgi:hypothetical protein
MADIRTAQDFVRYLTRLVKDWVFLVSSAYGIISLLVDTYGKPSGDYSILFSRWFYFTLWWVGLLIAAYRLDRFLRNQISAEDIVVEHRWFSDTIEPQLIQQGFRVNYPQPNGVHRLSLEGWEQVYKVGGNGTKRRYVIEDAGRIVHVPMRRRGGR